MKIEEFIKEIKLIINNDLYEKKLITYEDYIKVIKEARKNNKCL